MQERTPLTACPAVSAVTDREESRKQAVLLRLTDATVRHLLAQRHV